MFVTLYETKKILVNSCKLLLGYRIMEVVNKSRTSYLYIKSLSYSCSQMENLIKFLQDNVISETSMHRYTTGIFFLFYTSSFVLQGR